MSAARPFRVVDDSPVDDANQDGDTAQDQGLGGYILADGPSNLSWLRSELGAQRMPGVFQRGHELVYVASLGEEGYVPPRREGDDNGPGTVAPLTPLALSTRVTDRFDVRKMTNSGPKPTWFPTDTCARLLETPDELPYVRVLRGVTRTPVARADAGLLTAPGYDETSGFLLEPSVEVGIVPEAPTDEQVRVATAYLRNLVAEFAWADEHSEAGFWAAMLTPLLRLATPGPYKLIALTAHERGSGKSLLADLLRVVHGGSLAAWPADDAEVEKMISSTLYCTTGAIAVTDNVRGTLQSARLEALATTAEYSVRILGSTNRSTLKNDRLWVFTGNNLKIGGDLDRRMTWVSLDPGVENPELRTGFSIPNLVEYVTAHRGEVLRALLTWMSAWDAAGRPTGTATSDSYGQWIATVRSILDIAGVPGTFDHQDVSRAAGANEDEAEWGQFLAALREEFGERTWAVREVVDLMAAIDLTAKARGEALLDALPTQLYDLASRPAGPKGIRRSLGKWIGNRVGQFRGGLAIADAGQDRHKVKVWKVVGDGA